MKKIILLLLISTNIQAQNLDTVSVSLTLRAQDWAWGIGKYGTGNDSLSRARVRAIRTAIIAANPSTWATNVTINNVPGRVVIFLYNSFMQATFGEMFQMGTTNAERITIYTNIRAINNSVLQYYIGGTDGMFPTMFLNTRNTGKSIVMDN